MPTANYKESAVVGTKWTRAVRVQIDNPFASTPSILFVEEEAIQLGDEVITKICGNLTATFDPANPDHMLIYQKLDELYTLLRGARDAAELAPPVEI